jgi:hypothetical protein
MNLPDASPPLSHLHNRDGMGNSKRYLYVHQPEWTGLHRETAPHHE